ncbi:MAG: hypothetical protein AAB834_01620, partial [Patescibacteria group bacterium]
MSQHDAAWAYLRGNLSVEVPNTGETWNLTEPRNITWAKKGNISTVRIYYSSNNGSNWTSICNSEPAGSLNWTWTLNSSVNTTTLGYIKVADNSKLNITYDISDVPFQIRGKLNVTKPSEPGEVITYNAADDYYLVNWTKTGPIQLVNITYSTNGGATYLYNVSLGENASNSSFNWTNIPDKIGYNLSIKISDAANPAVNDTSDNFFAMKGNITVIQPNGSESWVKGSIQQIQWKTTGTYHGQIETQYCNDSTLPSPVWQGINNTSAGNDSVTVICNWTIPDDITSKAKVRVLTQENNASIDVNDTSDNAFKIKGGVTVTEPNTNTTWYVGEEKQINWTSSGNVTPVMIRYSTNNGSNWYNITTSSPAAPGDNSYNWTVNGTMKSARCLINISDARINFTEEVFDTSDVTFNVYPQINITKPYGGQNVSAHSNNTQINWTCTGSTIAKVNIDYTETGGEPWLRVQNETEANATNVSTGSTGSYLWMVPTTLCSDTKIRVTDIADANVTSSTSKFNIVGNINIKTPDGG